jgi:serine/threonine protein kinase/tetratricopeptide (TPR) repeat protein
MGVVYRARDTRLEREVAVKILPDAFAQDPNRRARFEREAKVVAALSHPNILAIHDLGTHEGIMYAVMELLQGETLRSRLIRGPMPWREAVEVGAEIADGLAAAHAKSIVHRDLKPENLFLTTDSRVKILDFGLARVEPQPQVGSETASYVPALTDPGAVMGTTGYMSPEQVRGLVIDGSSDIFSLGCVLYEMVAGRRPFQRKTAADSAAAILHDEPPGLVELGVQVPPGLEQAIRLCLAKRPEDRPASDRVCASVLRALLSDRQESLLLPTRLLPKQAQRQRRKPIDSLAILPLINTSGDANTEYLSDGITESIINILSTLPKLRVMARSTVFRFKGRDQDPQEIGRMLNVRAVLTGSVLAQGGRVVVKAELVDAADGAQLFGEHHDRELTDLAAVEQAIAKEIAENLRLRLTAEQKKRIRKPSPNNPEAYQLYLKGHYFWEKRTREGLERAIEYFRNARDADPNYALAWAGLADVYAVFPSVTGSRPSESIPKAKAAAKKALDLDRQLAEAHATLAVITTHYEFNWSEGERHFKRAIALNPNNPTACRWYGQYLTAMERFDDAEEQFRRALDLDPLSLIVNVVAGRRHYYARRHDAAIEQYCKALELDSRFWMARFMLAEAYAETGKYDEALADLRAVEAVSEGHTYVLSLKGRIYSLMGKRSEAQKVIAELRALSQRRYVSPYRLALVYASLGEDQEALMWLEKAYEEPEWFLIFLRLEPPFRRLREKPGFGALLHRMNFTA